MPAIDGENIIKMKYWKSEIFKVFIDFDLISLTYILATQKSDCTKANTRSDLWEVDEQRWCLITTEDLIKITICHYIHVSHIKHSEC